MVLAENKFEKSDILRNHNCYKNLTDISRFNVNDYLPSSEHQGIEVEDGDLHNIFASRNKSRSNLISIYKTINEREGQLEIRTRDLNLELCGKDYTIPKDLESIVIQIQEAKEILTYPSDWNDEGALSTDEETFKKAASFVIKYALWIYNKYNTIVITPYIDIMTDGSISVHWKKEEAQFLIIFNKKEAFKQNEKELAYFYAEGRDNKIPFKSAVDPYAPVDEFIALWLEKNLT